MNTPRIKILLSLLLGCMLGIPGYSIHAAEPDPLNILTLENPVQFLDMNGRNVLVPSGDYSVEVGPDQFTLKTDEGDTFVVEAEEGAHTGTLQEPSLIFLPGDPGEETKPSLLIEYYPDGKTLQAVGRAPSIVSRGAMALTDDPPEFIDPAVVTFEQPAYFIAPDGSPIVVQPGTYRAEATQSWIRLIPGKNRTDALLVEAQHGTHDTGIEDLLALSIPGETPQDLDVHYLVVLLPSGKSLEAAGSHSGIQKRGFGFKKKWRGLKKRVKRKYNRAKKSRTFKQLNNTAKIRSQKMKGHFRRGWTGARWAAGQAGKGIQIGARWTVKQAKWVGNQIAKGLDILKCRSIVSAITVGDQLDKLQKLNPLAPIMKEIGKQSSKFLEKIQKDAKLENHIKNVLPKELDGFTPYLLEANRILTVIKDPANRKKVKGIFSAKNICEGPPKRMVNKLVQLHGKPQFKQAASSVVKSRGIPPNIAGTGGRFYMSYGLAFTLEYKAGGIPFGFFLVTDYKNDTRLNFYIGGQVAASADQALEMLFQVGFYNGIQQASELEKWGMTAGIGINPSMLWKAAAAPSTGGASMAAPIDLSAGIDWAINPKKFFSNQIRTSVQGILLSGGVSISYAPGGPGEMLQIGATYAGH